MFTQNKRGLYILCNLATEPGHGMADNKGLGGAEGLRKRRKRAHSNRTKEGVPLQATRAFWQQYQDLGDINKALATEQKGSAEATLGKEESAQEGSARGGRVQQRGPGVVPLSIALVYIK